MGGLSEGNVQLATAMAADISDERQRGSTMALVGACFSIAFTFGPALGAALANVSTVAANPFATAAGFSLGLILIETLYLWLYLPETKPVVGESVVGEKSVNGKANGHGAGGVGKRSGTNSHLLINFTHFVFILFFSGMEFSFPFMTYDLFGYRSSQSGKLLGFIGLIASILQGSVTRRLHPLRVVQIGVVACAAAFLLLSTLTTETQLYGAASLLAVTTATVVTGLNSLSSFEAGEGERGGKLGNHRSWGKSCRISAMSHGLKTNFLDRSSWEIYGTIALLHSVLVGWQGCGLSDWRSGNARGLCVGVWILESTTRVFGEESQGMSSAVCTMGTPWKYGKVRLAGLPTIICRILESQHRPCITFPFTMFGRRILTNSATGHSAPIQSFLETFDLISCWKCM